jgi:hypothetical protein
MLGFCLPSAATGRCAVHRPSRRSCAPRPPDQCHRHSEDHRQRHLVRPENLWIRNCGYRGEASHLFRQRRSRGRTQRDRVGETDGSRFGIHGGQLREPPFHPSSHSSRRVRTKEDPSGRRFVEQRPRVNGSASGHALNGPLPRRSLGDPGIVPEHCAPKRRPQWISGMLDTSSSWATSDKRRSICIARAATLAGTTF